MLEIIYVAMWLATDRLDDCTDNMSCTGSIWELRLMPNDVPVSFGDMTQKECEALKEQIQDQAPQWQEFVCVEVPVSRQDI